MTITPFPNLCTCINCHQFDLIMGWASGTCGTPAMLDSEGNAVMQQNILLSNGGTYSMTVTVTPT